MNRPTAAIMLMSAESIDLTLLLGDGRISGETGRVLVAHLP